MDQKGKHTMASKWVLAASSFDQLERTNMLGEKFEMCTLNKNKITCIKIMYKSLNLVHQMNNTIWSINERWKFWLLNWKKGCVIESS